MTTYSIERQVPDLDSPVTEKVKAGRVEIEEGGVLAFYEEPNIDGEGASLRSVTSESELVVAYSEWDAFMVDEDNGQEQEE
jgi:hypothetical protein